MFFSLTSARVLTCPVERVIWSMLKIQGKGKGESFEGVKQRDNDYCNVLYNKRFRYTLYTTTGCYCGNK